ncbi:MAG: DsrE/DsrF/DrsH-like family protein [Proteobacteria bacterium]|nr:DsrE/DsrF/DrsH-like family protein [Pseudomonadota bacterium]
MSFPFSNPRMPSDNAEDQAPGTRKIALICAKGGLDECLPVLIMANAARMTGIECSVFFTFYGLDVVTESRVDHLHVNFLGNPMSPMPNMVAGLPGMEAVGTGFMQRKMDELDIPRPREMVQMLHESGCDLYGCELAMKMFDRTKEDLLPVVQDVITATDFFERTAGADIIFV